MKIFQLNLLFFNSQIFIFLQIGSPTTVTNGGQQQIIMSSADLAAKLKDGLPTQVLQVPTGGFSAANVDWAAKLKVL